MRYIRLKFTKGKLPLYKFVITLVKYSYNWLTSNTYQFHAIFKENTRPSTPVPGLRLDIANLIFLMEDQRYDAQSCIELELLKNYICPKLPIKAAALPINSIAYIYAMKQRT